MKTKSHQIRDKINIEHLTIIFFSRANDDDALGGDWNVTQDFFLLFLFHHFLLFLRLDLGGLNYFFSNKNFQFFF